MGYDKQEMHNHFRDRYTEREVATGIQELEEDGLIFHTIDTDHHRATKLDPGTTKDVFLF